MGLIRILLAFAVVIAHSKRVFGFAPIAPGPAVQAFYIISGFYMAMVLSSKYDASRRGTLLFYQNRYLRLMPTYLIVFALTSVASLAIGKTFYFTIEELRRVGHILPWSTTLYLATVNLLVVGQDTAMFTSIDEATGGLAFCPDYSQANLAAYKFLLVPQAWSIGVEMAFYAIAPFLLRMRTRSVLFIGGASILLRIALYAYGFRHDPWTYRFFPNELALFLSGSLAFRAYRAFPAFYASRRLQNVVLGGSIASIVLFEFVPLPDVVKLPLFLALFACGVPALFDRTKKNGVDRMVGELSYPIYICHLLVNRLTGWTGEWRGLASCLASAVLAGALMILVERPLDAWRQRRTLQRLVPSPAN